MKQNSLIKTILSWPYTIWIVTAIAAFIFLFVGIEHESMWVDEAFSAGFVQHNLVQITHYTFNDVHPPLYYYILKLFGSIFGSSVIALRLASLIGALAFVGLGAGPVKRLFGQKIALIFTGLVIFAPISLSMSHEVRMYTWMNFFTLAGVVYGYAAIIDDKIKDWVMFGLFTLAGAYTHYISLVALFFAHLIIFIYILIKARNRFKQYLITTGCVLLLYSPWLIVFLIQTYQTSKGFWIPPANALDILQALILPFSPKFKIYPPSWFSITAFLLSLGIIVYGIVRLIKEKKNEEVKSILLFFSIFILTVLFIILFSWLVVPILVIRYMTACAGIYLLATALAICTFKKQVFQIGIFTVLLLLMLPINISIFTEKYNGPMREIAAEIKNKLNPEHIIIHGDIHSISSLWYYLPKVRQAVIVPFPGGPEMIDPDFYKADLSNFKDISEIIGKEKHVWIMNRNGGMAEINPNDFINAGYEEKYRIKEYYYPKSWFKVSGVYLEYTALDKPNTK